MVKEWAISDRATSYLIDALTVLRERYIEYSNNSVLPPSLRRQFDQQAKEVAKLSDDIGASDRIVLQQIEDGKE